MKKAYHIAIEGAIGVGKTSLAKLLSKELNAKLILEEFEENPFLSGFYKDRQTYAFQTQLFFLISRYKQHQKEFQQMDIFSRSIISDYMYDKDKIFALANLDDEEFDLYNKVANEFDKNITSPDLVIFLQSDIERLMKNIKQRGRLYEKNMDREYIEKLNEWYNKFFFKYEKSPVLVINANDIDFVHDKNDLEEIINIVKQEHKTGTKYFNPAKSSNI